MKVLQICSKVFWPERDGGAIAMYAFADGLVKGGAEVHTVCLNIDKLYVSPDNIPNQIYETFHLKTFDVSLSFNFFDALVTTLQFKNYHVSRFYNRKVEDYLNSLLHSTEFDVIVLETLFTAIYLPIIKKYSKAKIILRAHNVEADIWQRLSCQSQGRLSKYKFRLMSEMLRHYESRIAKEVDAILCLTDADSAFFRSVIRSDKVHTVPLSIDSDFNGNIQDFSTPTFYHLASMEWLPHQQAIEWFLSKVVPFFKADAIKPKIVLAGRKMPLPFFNYTNEWLKVEDEITNPKQWVSNKNILIVPSFTGSGVRVKTIEAMARGHVVITTPNGTEGIPFTNWENIIVVDSPEEFAEAIRLCNSNPALCLKIAQNAKKLAFEVFNRKVVGEQCLKLLKEL